MEANIVDQYGEIENLINVINIDGTQTIFVDERYIPTITKAILLPENESQYIINDTGNILFDTNFETPFNNVETIQYTENTQVKVEEQDEVVYYTDGVEASDEMRDEYSQSIQFGFIGDMDPSLKTAEIGDEFINIDSVLKNINSTTETGDNGETQNYQYIVQFENYDVLADSTNSCMNAVQKNFWDERNSVDESSQYVDISKITGKNLLTGQTVTLDSYLEKVKNINKELTLEKAEEISQNIRKRSQHSALNNLLNKKLTIGKTLTGQRLIGKVIHVGKKELDIANDIEYLIPETCLTDGASIDEDAGEMEENSVMHSNFNYEPISNEGLNNVILENNQTDASTISIDNQNEMLDLMNTDAQPTECNDLESLTANETKLDEINQSMFEYVSRTLTKLMTMESISKKLKRKNLLIKVTEKIIISNNKHKLNVYQLRGHLEMLGGWEEEGYEEKWIFKLDEESVDDDTGSWNRNHKKFPESKRITIAIVLVDGIVQSTKVNLNYCQEKCSICSKEFRTIYKLKSHLKLVHQIAESQFYCQLCDGCLDNKDMFTQHRQYHVERGELFQCAKCDKDFLTELKLARHMLSHDPAGIKLKCTICGESCSKVSTWKKHMLTHSAAKPYSFNLCYKQLFTLVDHNYHSRAQDPCYVCKVCNRTFSRYSNLQRHSEIHGTKNSRSAYSCSVCGCTYNYVSSLTRHIVQNHISAS